MANYSNTKHNGGFSDRLQMSHIASSVCLSVCLSVRHTPVSCAKTAEPIEMLSALCGLTHVGPMNHVLEIRDAPREGALSRGEVPAVVMSGVALVDQHRSPDAAVDRVEVGAVSWPEVVQNKCWYLLLE